jgi:hypothetical protein
MQIIHRISQHVDAAKQLQLHCLGIDVECGLAAFEVKESARSWPALARLIAKWDSLDIVRTEFESDELQGANYLVTRAAWHYGYPQPDADFGYLRHTYNLDNYCSACGTGYVLADSFLMRREPKWGAKHILQLNWVFDEFFTTPSVWRSAFAPFGIGCLPVRSSANGADLQTVVQLDLHNVSQVSLRMDPAATFEDCAVCRRRKYEPHVRGYFPPLVDPAAAPVMKSVEYFGSGGSASNAIVISQALYQAIRRNKLRGVRFVPVRDS